MKKKKTIRNILIAAIALVLIVGIVMLAIALRKDGRGMNAFERGRTAASASGETVSMIDYAMTFDTLAQNYSGATLSDDQIKQLQENAATQALLMKIYTKEAKALGLTLTEEEEKACKDGAQQQLDSIVSTYTEQLTKNGGFSKAALDKQIASYYSALGMNQTQFYRYCKERNEASYYIEKLDEYYQTNGSGFSEEEVLENYHETVKSEMENYTPGQYSSSLLMYAYGYSTPLSFVPEGFFYVDFIEVSKTTKEEVEQIFNKVIKGGKEDASKFVLKTDEEGETEDKANIPEIEPMTFDELMASDDNVNVYRNVAEGPYAIGEDDYRYLFEDNEEAFETAKSLEIGQISTYIMPVSKTDTDGNELITGYIGYMFRRAEGTMCEEGQTGAIKIDHYPMVRENIEATMRQKKWMSDIVYTDDLYAYRGNF